MTKFQEIYANKSRKFLYDDGMFFSLLDSFPVNPGHALIIPVEPILSFFDLDEGHVVALYRVLHETKNVLESLDLVTEYERMRDMAINESSVQFCQKVLALPYINNPITGYNICNNDGRSAGRTIDHLHIHLIPRFDGDVIKPEGGVRHIIPGMGYYR